MSKFNTFPDEMTRPMGGLEGTQNSVFNFFLNKVTDGALQIRNGSLLQTMGAA